MPSPNPNWKPGDKIKSPVEEMLEIDPVKLKAVDRYKLLIGSIIPRPIAFVSTLSKSGVGNLAPFSFFNGVSSNPPCIMFSVAAKPDGGKKDTLINIEETGEFVINSSSTWLTEPLVYCGANFPYGINELERAGLTAMASRKVKPARVKESAVHMECKLYKTLQVGDGSPGSATIVVGEVVYFHVHSKAYKDGRVIFDELKPLARLGGHAYAEVLKSFELSVPEVAGNE